MPTSLPCPDCGEPLNSSEEQKGPEADRPPNEPAPTYFPGGAGDWKLVHLGLSMMHAGLLSSFQLALCFFVTFVAFIAPWGPAAKAFDVVAFLFLGALLISLMVASVGQFLCCTVPSDSGARGQASGSVVCLLLLVLAGAVVPILLFTDAPIVLLDAFGSHGLAMLTFMGLLFIVGPAVAGHTLILLFLRNIARYFRDDDLVETATGCLALFVAMVSVGLVSLLVAGFIPGTYAGLPCLAFCFVMMAFVTLVWYLVLLRGVRDLVAEAVRRAGG